MCTLPREVGQVGPLLLVSQSEWGRWVLSYSSPRASGSGGSSLTSVQERVGQVVHLLLVAQSEWVWWFISY